MAVVEESCRREPQKRAEADESTVGDVSARAREKSGVAAVESLVAGGQGAKETSRRGHSVRVCLFVCRSFHVCE